MKFFASAKHPWLSSKTFTGLASICGQTISECSSLAHSHSRAMALAAIYSASVDDCATIDCSALLQIIGPFAQNIISPVRDLLLLGSPANPEST